MCFLKIIYKLYLNTVHNYVFIDFFAKFVFWFLVFFLEYERVRKKEIDHILEILNRPEKSCEVVKLKEKGIVVHQESFITIFETLALGFEESSDIVAEKIMEELIMVKTFTEFLF